MSEKGVPSLLERHWAESALAIGAVVIAAVSLWVAYDTEHTNQELVAYERQLVAANSWPFVQIQENDSVPGGAPGMAFIMANQGIGPAKVETFEVFWKGEPQRSRDAFLRSCCGGTPDQVDYSLTHGVVLRAGQIMNFLAIPLDARDQPILAALRAGFDNLSFRYCYCSAFDECWLAESHFGHPHDLSPPRVRVCPQPKVPYGY
jgi:hypothetical protein